jgi:hypothetical protein
MADNSNAEKQIDNSPPGKEQQTVLIQQFNSMFTDIGKFNDQFSAGSMLSRMVKNLFVKDSEEPGATSLSKIGGEELQQMTASGTNLIHKPLLDAIGLSIEPVLGKGETILGQGEEINTGELRINITEKSKFLQFLKNIDNQNINPMLKSNLHALSNILAKQIGDNYDLQAPSDEALKLFGSLGDIVTEYKRLYVEGTEKLETCLMHSKQGDLREYLAIEQQGLLSEPGKNFGPADWQKDSTPTYLMNRWNVALSVLNMARENPKARDLYHKLFSHLQTCLKAAMDNLETLQYKDKDKLREVLSEVEQKFG